MQHIDIRDIKYTAEQLRNRDSIFGVVNIVAENLGQWIPGWCHDNGDISIGVGGGVVIYIEEYSKCNLYISSDAVNNSCGDSGTNTMDTVEVT